MNQTLDGAYSIGPCRAAFLHWLTLPPLLVQVSDKFDQDIQVNKVGGQGRWQVTARGTTAVQQRVSAVERKIHCSTKESELHLGVVSGGRRREMQCSTTTYTCP